MQAEQAIGVFDSGIGGLSVAKAIHDLLPHEKIIYFGDTLHLPYGEKSASAIQNYCSRIVDFLLNQKCKLIVIACHSASSVATELIKKQIGDKALLANVIEPVLDHVTTNPPKNHLGLIGTKRTINTGVYSEKIAENNLDITLHATATPLLAAAIEENFKNKTILKDILHEYLDKPEFQNISDLILGCTHYPVIKPFIESLHPTWNIIDPAILTAKYCKTTLEESNLLCKTDQFNQSHFYASDITSFFLESSKVFFGETIELSLFSENID